MNYCKYRWVINRAPGQLSWYVHSFFYPSLRHSPHIPRTQYRRIWPKAPENITIKGDLHIWTGSRLESLAWSGCCYFGVLTATLADVFILFCLYFGRQKFYFSRLRLLQFCRAMGAQISPIFFIKVSENNIFFNMLYHKMLCATIIWVTRKERTRYHIFIILFDSLTLF